MMLEAERILIRRPEQHDVEELLDLRVRNREFVQPFEPHAFGPAGLHRVQAAVMPRNAGSIRVLEKVGFHHDGFSEYYLKINGVWEHHNLYSVTQERWGAQRE